MGKEQGKRPMNVRLNRNGKNLNFSTKASIQLAGYKDVEVFEKENVVAVRGMVGQGYHISQEKGRPRMALSNAQLVEYICKKFGCTYGSTLPVWTGEQENVLFFGGMQPLKMPYVLDEHFTPIEVEYNRRAGDWSYVHDNWIEFTQEVRKVLPERLSAYRCGQVVVLRGDPAGRLVLTPRRQSGKRMLVSHALADYLRSLYGGEELGMRLHAALLPDGVALADSLDSLTKIDLSGLEKLVLDESKCCFLTPRISGTMYFSTMAWEQMERAGRVDVYGRAEYLALHVACEGDFPVTTYGYAHYIHSKQLCALVKKQWPEAKRLHVLRHGKLWLLWPNTTRPVGLPPPSQFRKVSLSKSLMQGKLQPQRAASAVAMENERVEAMNSIGPKSNPFSTEQRSKDMKTRRSYSAHSL